MRWKRTRTTKTNITLTRTFSIECVSTSVPPRITRLSVLANGLAVSAVSSMMCVPCTTPTQACTYHCARQVQTNTCQVCGRRRRRTTSHNDIALHFDDDEEEDEDLPRRNTLTSGCPVAKIANEVISVHSSLLIRTRSWVLVQILLHIFSYLNVRDIVSAASVCRKWRHITDDNYLWGDLILYHASRRTSSSPWSSSSHLNCLPIAHSSWSLGSATNARRR